MEAEQLDLLLDSNPRLGFLFAATQGDLTSLKRFALAIGNGSDLTKVVNPNGANVLHLAAASGNTQLCKFLIEDWKFDINPVEMRGDTPLIAAIQSEQYPTAVYLLENGAKIDHLNDGGVTAFHCAAGKGQMEIMHLMLSKGANPAPDLNTIKILTPLQCACIVGKEEAVKLLLDLNADPNATLEPYLTPLMMSVVAKSLECMELLLKAGADPNLGSVGKTPLIVAARKGDTRIIERLLKAGANPDVTDACKRLTPIQHAALDSNVDVVNTLFPFTSKISSIPEWSVSGIMEYASSKEAEEQMLIGKRDYFEKSKAKGREAFERKDYNAAIHFFSEAIATDLADATVFSNRSCCWLKLKSGDKALEDAKACIALKPDWPKGHYREGAAHLLLHDYRKATDAFEKAMNLDPNNDDINKAYREAVEAEIAFMAERMGTSGSCVIS